MNTNAVLGDQQVKHLSLLEQLFPKEISNMSKAMVKVFKKRIPKVKLLKQPLPDKFDVNGSIVIRGYYFSTIINKMNQIIDNQYKGNNYNRIKSSLRSMMTSINHASKHIIATQKGKLILLRIVKSLKTSTHYNNLHQTVNIIIHLISQCLVLNEEAFNDYHFLIERFNRTHK